MTSAITELRAYPVFDALPAGHVAVTMPDDRHFPHLRAGEVAVVDPEDRDVVSGELYLIGWSKPSVMQVVYRHYRPAPDAEEKLGAWFHPLARSTAGSIATAMRTGRPVFASDGPMKPEALPRVILGRVVGLLG